MPELSFLTQNASFLLCRVIYLGCPIIIVIIIIIIIILLVSNFSLPSFQKEKGKD
jgi:hypothetical protein